MELKNIRIGTEVSTRCPSLVLGCLYSHVKVSDSPEALKAAMGTSAEKISKSFTNETIATMPAIASSREAYRALGKDPARYRPSAEALLRRVVSGKGLYHVNNVVDLLNLVSISTGYSIGGYDVAHIEGDAVLGIGEEGEPYEGIGRGVLNIAGLPVMRDAKGAFGSPTSDSLRTSVTAETTLFLMVFFAFGGSAGMDEAMAFSMNLLEAYAGGGEFEVVRIAV